MSGVMDLVFGASPEDGQVVNTTPAAFQNLAGPLGTALQRLLRQPQQYTGPYTAQPGAGEQAALGAVGQAAQPQANSGVNVLQGLTGNFMNPFAALSGLEQQGLGQVMQQAFTQNPLQQNFVQQQLQGIMNPFAQAAPLGAGEAQGLQNIQQQAFAPNPQLQAFLGQQLGGAMNPYAQITGQEQQGLNSIQQTAFGTNPLQSGVNQSLMQLVQGGGQNPYAQQLMDAAIRPILQNFDQQALQQRGLFTGAGQQVQGAGSSPFAQASAQLTGNVANAVGDTTAQLGANLFGQQQQAQMQALGLAQQQPGLQLQQQLAGLSAAGLPRQLQSDAFGQMQANQFTAAGLGDQYASNNLARALQGTQALGLPRELQQMGLDLQSGAFQQGQQNQFAAAGLSDQFAGNALQRALAGLDAAGTGQERQAQAFESGADRQLQAGGQLAGAELAQQQAQLQAALQNLQAQGLPRMIEQLGIDAGLQQYNTQQTQIMDLMRLMGSLAQPNATVTPGTAGTQGLAQAFLSGFSDRRLKRDIQFAGNVGDTRWYRFRYLTDGDEMPLRLGVMADEVEHIPGAVTRHGEDRMALVNYGKVLEHAAA